MFAVPGGELFSESFSSCTGRSMQNATQKEHQSREPEGALDGVQVGDPLFIDDRSSVLWQTQSMQRNYWGREPPVTLFLASWP